MSEIKLCNHFKHPFSQKNLNIKVKPWQKIVTFSAGLMLAPLIIPGFAMFYGLSYYFKWKAVKLNSKSTILPHSLFVHSPPSSSSAASSSSSSSSSASSSSAASSSESTSISLNFFKQMNDYYKSDEIQNLLNDLDLSSTREEKKKCLKGIKNGVKNQYDYLDFLKFLMKHEDLVFLKLFNASLDTDKSIIKDLLKVLSLDKLSHFSDYSLLFGGKELAINKKLLSLYIPYFEIMFNFAAKENQNTSLALPDEEYDFFKNVFNLIFFKKDLKISNGNFLYYLEYADKYNLPKIKELCEIWAVGHLDDFDDRKELFKLANNLQMESLKHALVVELFAKCLNKNVSPNKIARLREWLQHIQKLNLSKCDVTNESLAWLKGSPLQTLIVKSEKVTNSGLSHLKNMQLTTLCLYCSCISDWGIGQLRNLPLRKLSISYKMCTGNGIDHLKGMNLKSLNLQCFNFSKKGLIALDALPIEGLLINCGCEIQNKELRHLKDLPITELWIQSSYITKEGLPYINDIASLRKFKFDSYVESNNKNFLKSILRPDIELI